MSTNTLFSFQPTQTPSVLRKERYAALRLLKRRHTPHDATDDAFTISITLPSPHTLSAHAVAERERTGFHAFATDARKRLADTSVLHALLHPVSADIVASPLYEIPPIFDTGKEKIPLQKHRISPAVSGEQREAREHLSTSSAFVAKDRQKAFLSDEEWRTNIAERSPSDMKQTDRKQDERKQDDRKQDENKHDERKSRRDSRDYQVSKEQPRTPQQDKDADRLQFLYQILTPAYSLPHNNLSLFITKQSYSSQKTQYSTQSALPVHSLVGATTHYFQKILGLPAQAVLLCAVSGGADSIAMLDIIIRVAETLQYRLHIVHCNHQLRGSESTQDAEFVRLYAERYGIDCTIATLRVRQFASSEQQSLEHSARTLRYACLRDIAELLGASAVCTAHTSDDSAETFLLNLIRGSGLTGLSGMKMQRNFTPQSVLVRPLLPYTKQDLIAYNHAHQLVWREDSSNHSMAFTRNKIRQQLLPLLEQEFSPAIRAIVARTAHLLAGADTHIHQSVQRYVQDVCLEQNMHYTKISCSALSLHDVFIQGEILQHIATSLLHIPALSSSTIDRVMTLIQSKPGSQQALTKTWSALRETDSIVFARTAHHTLPVTLLDTKKNTTMPTLDIKCSEIAKSHVKYDSLLSIENFDRALFPRSVMLRTWKSDDIFQPLGMSSPVAIGDFLAGQKIPWHLRQSIPVLANGNEIIWMIGIRIAEKYKIQASTVTALRIEIQPNAMTTLK